MGIRQAQVLGNSLRHRVPQVDAVISGAMKRHQQTAEQCLTHMGRPSQWQEDPGWNEYDHEQVIHAHKPAYRNRALMMADLARTLQPRRAFQKMFSEAVERWMSGEYDQDYAESWVQFEQRCIGALKQLVEQLGPSKTALVFTSGGPISAVSQDLLQIPATNIFKLNGTLANCGVTKLIYSERGIYLSSLNEHTAFEGEYAELITYR